MHWEWLLAPALVSSPRFIQYVLAAAAMSFVLFFWDELSLATFRIRKNGPRRLQKLREFLNSTRHVVISSLIYAGLISIAPRLGWTGDTRSRSVCYEIALLLGLFVIHDCYFYWTHRLMHDRRLFKISHFEHHRSNNPSPWTAYSFSVVEAVVQSLILPLFVLAFAPTPLVVLAFLVCEIIWNVLIHSGLELTPRWAVLGPGRFGLTGATHHDLHHRLSHSNYGLYFRFWDRLMGTEHPDFEVIYEYVRSRRNAGDAYRLIGARSRPSPLSPVGAAQPISAADSTAMIRGDDG